APDPDVVEACSIGPDGGTVRPTTPPPTDLHVRVLVTELVASSLLTVDPVTGHYFVDRWTASELAEVYRRRDRGDDVLQAHYKAFKFWHWRGHSRANDRAAQVGDLYEMRHHLLELGDVASTANLTQQIFMRLWSMGAWDRAEHEAHRLLAHLGPTDPERA